MTEEERKEDVTFLRQESNKEPVVQFIGRILVAAVCMKKTGKLRDLSKLDPMIFLVFFSLLRKVVRIVALVRIAFVCVRYPINVITTL